MPLMHGKSKKAFKHNIEAEMDAGKPQKQSLAIAYAVKKRGKKMANGGTAYEQKYSAQGAGPGIHTQSWHQPIGVSGAGNLLRKGDIEGSKKVHQKKLDELKSAPRNLIGLADGGDVDEFGYPKQSSDEHPVYDVSGYDTPKPSPTPKGQASEDPMSGWAKGGFISSHQTEAHDEDMVDRIMKQREQCYSEGGKVANDTHEFEQEFDEPNKFDYLERNDDLEFHDTGANSGDELGNDQEDHDRSDIVSKIMASRKKKDRLPSPA